MTDADEAAPRAAGRELAERIKTLIGITVDVSCGRTTPCPDRRARPAASSICANPPEPC